MTDEIDSNNVELVPLQQGNDDDNPRLKLFDSMSALNDHITPNDMEFKQVWILWLSVGCMVIFDMVKYVHGNDFRCNIYSDQFSMHCDYKYLHLTEAITYLLLLMLFCCFTDLRFVIYEQIKKTDVLLFPFVILCIMATLEFLYGILYYNQHEGWGLLLLIIQICSSSLLFGYAVIIGNVPRFSNDIGRKTLMGHVIFGHLAGFAVVWSLIDLFVFDFIFPLTNERPIMLVLVMLECILLIEWIHVVIECWLHDEDYQHYLKSYESDTSDQTDDDSDDDAKTQHWQYNDNKPQKLTANKLLMDNEYNGNILFYFAWILQIVSFCIIILELWPFAEADCSGFEIGWQEWNTCPSWKWVVEFCFVSLSVCLIIIRMCFMNKDEFDLISFQLKRLDFPFVIWIILILINLLYCYVANPYYILIVGIDLFGYIALFIQSLFVIIMRIYKKGDGGNMFCPRNLKFMQLISWIYCIFIIFKIVMNFVSDALSIEIAAERLAEYNEEITSSTVEAIAFIQIVFANTLLTEYLHVICGSVHHDQYVE